MSPRRARAVREHPAEPATALREHLLDTAERLLGDRPPSALTTREIARAADVSDGVLYNYFADKDELVVAAAVRRFARLLAAYREAVPEPATATVEANLTTIARAAFDLHAAALPIGAGLLSDPALLRRFTEEIHREPVAAVEIVGSIERYLTAEQAAGRVGDDVDAAAAADLIVGAVAVQVFTTVLGAPAEAALARVATTVDTLVRGLEPPR